MPQTETRRTGPNTLTQNHHNLADEELARRALAGSADSFEEIVRRYQVPLMHFLHKRFPSRRDAEDILQDTFLKAWQSLHLFNPAYSFRTWLYTISYRLAVSRGRRLSDNQSGKGNDQPLQTFNLAANTAAPDAAAEQSDQHQNLWSRARQVLSEEQYMALWLHYVDEVPAPDIAKILNRSWVGVKTLMHRARKKLLPYLTGDGFESALQSANLQPAGVSAASKRGDS